MKITFVGVGSAFTLHDYQSNLLIEEGGKRFLLDCGTDIRHALHALHLGYNDVDAVYISHLHADHCGGLEWLAFSNFFDSGGNKPALYMHPSVQSLLWEHSLAAGLRSLGKRDALLSDYFKVHGVSLSFRWMGITFKLIKTEHVQNNGLWMPSYGLFIIYKKHRIFITTDAQFRPLPFKKYYEAAHVIFHDCELRDPPSEVHAHYTQLCSLPSLIRKKIWLYHYQTSLSSQFQPQKDGFNGFVERGQLFDFS